MSAQEVEIRAAAAAIPAGEAVFVAKAAHELRGALCGIDILASALVDRVDGQDDVELAALAQQLARQSKRIEAMAHQLLDLTRFGDGRSDARLEPVNLSRFLDTIVAAEGLDPGRTIDLQIAEDLMIETDPLALEQIVANLLRNAHRHGGETIEVAGEVDGGRVVLHVVDDGPGVPERVRDRLFEPFVRSSLVDGNGLGLAIVAELATALDGEVRYEPNEPNGSRFSVSLPLH